MIDGSYRTEIETPMGRKQITVVLRTRGDEVFADVDAPIIGKQHISGSVEGDSFTLAGKVKALLIGKVSYTAEGRVQGDDLRVVVHTSKGDLDLVGTRM